jgi:class 3 adenylate cyclase
VVWKGDPSEYRLHRASLLALDGGTVNPMGDYFAGVPLLKNVAQTLVDTLQTRGFEQGEKLIAKGDEPTCILVIRSGSVLVEINGVRLVTRKQNEVVGEQAFINGEPHSADCIALSPVEAVCISKADAATFLRDPAFVENLLRELSGKLRESTRERYIRYGTGQRLFSEFRSHVGREVRDKLLDDRTDYGAPQQIEDVAVLFSDIRGFTSYVHEAGPANSARLADELSPYFAAITELIQVHGGFVDKFIGDAVMAFWSYPGTDRPHNDVILTCAEEMIATASRHTFGGRPARIGIGIEQGTCFMGNVGSDHKRQFTIIGDAVNVASRLETKTKNLGNIVVGATFFSGLSTQRQLRLALYENQDLRGTGQQSIYSLTIEGN